MAEELDELMKKAAGQGTTPPAENHEGEEQVPPGFPGGDDEEDPDVTNPAKEAVPGGSGKNQPTAQGEPYFTEDMPAEEILQGFMMGVEASGEPVIMNLHGENGERIQVEGITEEQDRAELDHRMVDPNTVNDHMQGINVYVNGHQVTAEQFCQFIEEHKAEFVAVCNERFPNMAEITLAQRKDLTLQEKQYVLTKIEGATRDSSVSGRTATPQDEKKAGDLDEQMQKAALAKGRQELRYAQDRLDDLPKYNAQFYIQGKDGVDMVEFSRYTTKDGKEKTGMKLNGKYVSDKEMAKFLSKYPGQLGKQVDSYIAVQKAAQLRVRGGKTYGEQEQKKPAPAPGRE